MAPFSEEFSVGFDDVSDRVARFIDKLQTETGNAGAKPDRQISSAGLGRGIKDSVAAAHISEDKVVHAVVTQMEGVAFARMTT